MGSIKRQTCIRPIPAKATIEGSKVKWTRAGKRRVGELVVKHGKQFVRIKSDTYTAKYRDAGDVVRSVSTQCRDKDAARAKLAALELEADRIRAGTLTASEVTTAKAFRASIDGHVDSYLAQLKHQPGKGKRARVSPNHLVDAERSLRLIVSECNFLSLKSIDRERVKEWVSAQLADKERDWANKTINSHLSALNAFCNWAMESKRMAANPLARFPMLNSGKQKNPRRAITPDEFDRLLKAARLRPIAEFGRLTVKLPEGSAKPWTLAPLSFATIDAAYTRGCEALSKSQGKIDQLEATGQERALIYAVLVSTGLRRGELASLSVSQVDFAQNAITLEAEDEKNGQGSTIPLREDVSLALRQHVDANQLQPKDKLLNVPDKLIRILDHDLVAADIPKIDGNGRRVVVHSTRNTFATMLNVAGVAPRVAQQAMRHSDIKLTMKNYTDSNQIDVAGAIEKLPKLNLASKINTPKATPTIGFSVQNMSQNGPNPTPGPHGVETKKPLQFQGKARVFHSRGDRIRTYDPLVPNQMR